MFPFLADTAVSSTAEISRTRREEEGGGGDGGDGGGKNTTGRCLGGSQIGKRLYCRHKTAVGDSGLR